MKLPGRLKERHIKAAMDRKDKIMIYKGKVLNVEEIWIQILKEKKNVRTDSGHNELSDGAKKSKGLLRSDTDSGDGDSTKRSKG